MPNTGDRPGKGMHRCLGCGYEIYLEDDRDALPYCPRCYGDEYMP